MTKLDVPTNGSRRPDAAATSAAELPRHATDDRGAAPPPDYTGAVSPRQLAAGFAIVAALIVLLVRRRSKA